MRKELRITKLRHRSFIHIRIKTNISRAKLSCLASWSVTPGEISKKVSFKFRHFHAFALWLIYNIYWAPVSFFKAKREDGAILWIPRWFLSRCNPVNLGHRYHSIIYKGKRELQFSKKLFFVHHHGAVLELQNHPLKPVYLCELLPFWFFHSVFINL